MSKFTDMKKYLSIYYPFGNDIIPMFPNKNQRIFWDAIYNGDIEILRKDEQFNNLISSIIKLCKKKNKNITREEAENLVIDSLGKPKETSKTESVENIIEKNIINRNNLTKLSNNTVKDYILKHR